MEFYLGELVFGNGLQGELDSQPPCRAEARAGIIENWKRNGNQPCGFILCSHVPCFPLALDRLNWDLTGKKLGRCLREVRQNCCCCVSLLCWVSRTAPRHHITHHPPAVCPVLLFAPPCSLRSQENGASTQTISSP